MIAEAVKFPARESFPVLIEPGEEKVFQQIEGFLSWFEEHLTNVNDLVAAHGGVLLRDTLIGNDSDFARFVNVLAVDGTLNYVSGNSPRLKVSDGVYTSTELAAAREIPIHNEMSYTADWPAKIIFCSILPAETGGETPLANCNTIYKNIPAYIRDEFEQKQIAYIRNLHGGSGIGPSWMDTFETDNWQQVSDLLVKSGIGFSWKTDGGLWMEEIRPAVIDHPEKKCKVWFNQADEFHPSANGPELYQAMIDLYGGDISLFPMYARFGDGTEIPIEYLDIIRKVIKANTIKFPWRKGDVLILDNRLIGHGRMPYTGKRRTLVAMTR